MLGLGYTIEMYVSYVPVAYLIARGRLSSRQGFRNLLVGFVKTLGDGFLYLRVECEFSSSSRLSRPASRSTKGFDKRQLAPSNTPRPLTRAYLRPLRTQTSSVPPFTIQPIITQQPYSAQEVYVEPNRVKGAR